MIDIQYIQFEDYERRPNVFRNWRISRPIYFCILHEVEAIVVINGKE